MKMHLISQSQIYYRGISLHEPQCWMGPMLPTFLLIMNSSMIETEETRPISILITLSILES